MNYIAHINEKGVSQSLADHLTNVAKKSAHFADVFQSGDIAYLIGLLHDIGKYSDAFQRCIRGSLEQIDHSTAGAQLLNNPKINVIISRIAGYVIMGHHSGLPDYGSEGDSPEEPTFNGRIKKAIEDFCAYSKEIHPNFNPDIFKLTSICEASKEYDFSIQFFVRML